MKNWSGIFDLLNPDNTMTFNRLIAHSIGAVETIIYFALISKCRYWEINNQLLDGEWFYSTTYDLQESTTFSEYQQKKAINKLEKLDLIRCTTKGIPAKRCFVINDDLNLLYSIIEDGRKISEQLHEKSLEKNHKKSVQRKQKSEQVHVHNLFTSTPKNSVESSSEVFLNKSVGAINNSFTSVPENTEKSSSKETAEQAFIHKLFTCVPENTEKSSSEETAEQAPEKLQNRFPRNFGTGSSVFKEQYLLDNLNKNNLNENNLSYPINQSKDNFKDLSNSSEKETIDKIDMDRYTKYKELIYSNIDYEDLIAQNESDRNKIDEIVENMLDMLCCTAPSMKISGNEISTEVVHSRVLKIESSHIDYILICLKRNTTKVRNIKAYLRAVIYNAPSTMDIFLDADINNALFSPKLE